MRGTWGEHGGKMRGRSGENFSSVGYEGKMRGAREERNSSDPGSELEKVPILGCTFLL